MRNKSDSIETKKEKLPLKDDLLSKFNGTQLFQVWMLLDNTQFTVARLRDYELSKIGITPEQAAILQILSKRESKSSISEISLIWMRRENSVLTLVRRMEKLGLVDILKHPGRKELEVVMTEKGGGICSKITRLSIESVFGILSEEEIQKMSLYLRLLLERARNMIRLIEE
jgi:DNA-binding MarR family transcriptional regulator